MTVQVAVIGGSIAGLSTAALLSQLGAKVSIFERSSHLHKEPGGGIVVQPALLELLKHIGAPHLDSFSVPLHSRQFLDSAGNVVESSRGPQAMTGWEPIWRRLYGLTARYFNGGVAIAGVLEDASSGLAQLETATTENSCIGSFNLVVISDGAGSIVRQSLFGSESSGLQYAGYIAWRGVVGEWELPADLRSLFDGYFTFYHGPKFHMLVYLIPSPVKDEHETSTGDVEAATVSKGSRLVNWVWYWDISEEKLQQLLVDVLGVQRHFSVPPGKLSASAEKEMREASAAALPPQLQALVEMTTQPFLQPIYDFAAEKLVHKVGKKSWAVLVGDAACVLRPHTAYGAANAAEDAIALGGFLKREGCLTEADTDGSQKCWEDALNKWQKERLKSHFRWSGRGQQLGARK